MKKLMHHLSTLLVAILIATLAFTQTAVAQDASQLAIQATQQAQQANQQAQQVNQQASQQAQQAMQDAQSSSSSVSQPYTPPRPLDMPLPNGPIPSQIANAHKIFLSNAGADANFPVDENTAFTAVFNSLQSWGKYQFVTAPADADLIFQLQDIAPITGVTGDRNSTYSINSPAFLLTIVDARTNTPLWTVTSPVDLRGSGKNRARWFAIATTNLVSRVKVLANQPLTTEETADLTTFPKTHGKLAATIIVGSVVALAVGGFLIAHHEFDNSLANQKASQDAFCNANHIPLSECAGG